MTKAPTELWRAVDRWRMSQTFPPNQSALAKHIGVGRSTVSQWKNGDSRPSPDHMRAIQSATGIRYRDLLDAMLADMGYLPKEVVADGDAAPIATQVDRSKHTEVQVQDEESVRPRGG